jgi:hypothetical protein
MLNIHPKHAIANINATFKPQKVEKIGFNGGNKEALRGKSAKNSYGSRTEFVTSNRLIIVNFCSE